MSNFNAACADFLRLERITGIKLSEDLAIPAAWNYKQPQSPCPDLNCPECTQQWRQDKDLSRRAGLGFIYDEILTPTAAAASVANDVRSLSSDHSWLRKTLELRGDEIMARWVHGNRQSYVESAIPELYPHACPIRRTLFLSKISNKDARGKHKELMMMPYLNAETLVADPHVFLRLVLWRTLRHYGEFMMLDKEEHKLAFETGLATVHYSGLCVDMTPTSTYGQLVPFNKEKAHTWQMVGYPRAKFILSSQVALYHNLRKLVETLLAVGKGIKPLNGQWHDFTSQPHQVSDFPNAWARYNRAYFEPSGLDYQDLCNLTSSRHRAADDHLWLLQTDTAYVKSAVEDIVHTDVMKKASDDAAYRKVYETLWLASFESAQYWRSIEGGCQILRYIASCAGKDRDDPLTLAGTLHGLALCSLRSLISCAYTTYRRRLPIYLAWTPAFESYFETISSPSGFPKFKARQGTRDEQYALDPLYCCLYALVDESGDEEHQTDPDIMFNFFENYIRTEDIKKTSRLPQKLLDLMSDFSSLQEIRKIIRLQPPRHTCRSSSNASTPTGSKKCSNWWPAMQKKQTMPAGSHRDILKVTKPLVSQILSLPYVQAKPGSAKQLKADTKLNAFWIEARKIALHDSPTGCDLELFKFACCDEQARFIEHQKQLLEELEDPQAGRMRRANVVPVLAEPVQSEWGVPAGRDSEISAPSSSKAKVKTRAAPPLADPANPHNAPDPPPPATEPPPPSPTIPAKKATRRILTRLFSTLDRTGTTRWADFVSAMSDAGFNATGASGSATSFRNNSLVDGGCDTVVIHRPHPSSELQAYHLRCIGKRMNKWFGWTEESFVPR